MRRISSLVIAVIFAVTCSGCGGRSGSFSSTKEQRAEAQRHQEAKAEKRREDHVREKKQLQDYNGSSKKSSDQTPAN